MYYNAYHGDPQEGTPNVGMRQALGKRNCTSWGLPASMLQSTDLAAIDTLLSMRRSAQGFEKCSHAIQHQGTLGLGFRGFCGMSWGCSVELIENTTETIGIIKIIYKDYSMGSSLGLRRPNHSDFKSFAISILSQEGRIAAI